MANRKLRTRCPFAVPTTPAFTVPARTACRLISDGLAIPICDSKASRDVTRIQLTFSKIAHLRDRSLKIDEAFLIAYAAGERWARNLFDNAWDGRVRAEVRELVVRIG